MFCDGFGFEIMGDFAKLVGVTLLAETRGLGTLVAGMGRDVWTGGGFAPGIPLYCW